MVDRSLLNLKMCKMLLITNLEMVLSFRRIGMRTKPTSWTSSMTSSCFPSLSVTTLARVVTLIARSVFPAGITLTTHSTSWTTSMVQLLVDQLVSSDSHLMAHQTCSANAVIKVVSLAEITEKLMTKNNALTVQMITPSVLV